MKARRIDLSESFSLDDAMRRIAIVRFAEVLSLAPALRHKRETELHDLRIACKRLRYTMERFSGEQPTLAEAAVRLAQLQDALGEAHDRDVLLGMMDGSLSKTIARIRNEREACIERAKALWHDAFAPFGPFEGLVHFTGLGPTPQSGYGVGVALGA